MSPKKELSFRQRLDKFLDIVNSKKFEESNKSAVQIPQGLCSEGKKHFLTLLKGREDSVKFLTHYRGCGKCLFAFNQQLKTMFR